MSLICLFVLTRHGIRGSSLSHHDIALIVHSPQTPPCPVLSCPVLSCATPVDIMVHLKDMIPLHDTPSLTWSPLDPLESPWHQLNPDICSPSMWPLRPTSRCSLTGPIPFGSPGKPHGIGSTWYMRSSYVTYQTASVITPPYMPGPPPWNFWWTCNIIHPWWWAVVSNNTPLLLCWLAFNKGKGHRLGLVINIGEV